MSKTPLFAGFTPDTVRFLQELKENNYKEWFEAHREMYDIELLQPFKALIGALSPAMYNIDPQFELRPNKVLSRIYRDIRFSKNKDPYKTCLWMNFQRSTTNWQFFSRIFYGIECRRLFLRNGIVCAETLGNG